MDQRQACYFACMLQLFAAYVCCCLPGMQVEWGTSMKVNAREMYFGVVV